MFIALPLPAPRAWPSPRRCTSALVFCAAALGLTAHAQQPLSLDQALRLAQERSRQLPAHRQAIGSHQNMSRRWMRSRSILWPIAAS